MKWSFYKIQVKSILNFKIGDTKFIMQNFECRNSRCFVKNF